MLWTWRAPELLRIIEAVVRKGVMFMKTKTTTLTENERERVEGFESACHDLSIAIAERAGDFLVHRARTIAASMRRDVPPEAVAVLIAESAALAQQLREGLGRINWLDHWRFFYSRGGRALPVEFAPLGALIDARLSPLQTMYGLPTHPGSHNVLDECIWPGGHMERRCVTRYEPGIGSWRATEIMFVQHEIHDAFKAVADAAQRLTVIDFSKEPER